MPNKTNHYLPCLQFGLDNVKPDERKLFFLSALFCLESSSRSHTYGTAQEDGGDLDLLEKILSGKFPNIPPQVARFKLLEMIIYNVPNISADRINNIYNNILKHYPQTKTFIPQLLPARIKTYLLIYFIWECVLIAQALFILTPEDFIKQLQAKYWVMLIGGLLLTQLTIFFAPIFNELVLNIKSFFTGQIVDMNLEPPTIEVGLDALAEMGETVIFFKQLTLDFLSKEKNKQLYEKLLKEESYNGNYENYHPCPEALFLTELHEFLDCLKTHGIKPLPRQPAIEHTKKIN